MSWRTLKVLIKPPVVYNPGAVLVLIAVHPCGVHMFFDRWFVVVNVERALPCVHDKTLSIVAILGPRWSPVPYLWSHAMGGDFLQRQSGLQASRAG